MENKKLIPYEKSFASHEKSEFWSDLNEILPKDVYISSNKRYFFKCETCNHNFEIILASVVYANYWCSFCNSFKLCEDYNCDVCTNKSFKVHEKCKYFSIKNNVDPRNIPMNSRNKYLFDCIKCGHEFETQILSITKSNSWCSFCSSTKLCKNDNCMICFEKSFSSHEKNKNWSAKNKLNSREVFKKSDSKAIFDCEKCNHEFESRIINVSLHGHWCPFCNHQKLCENENCSTCLNNSFKSCIKSKYWSKKNDDKPRNVFKNAIKKYIFDCPTCENEFSVTLFNVTTGYWCPLCKNKTEKKLFNILIKLYPNIKHDFKVDWCKNIRFLPFDFAIKEHNIIIELDGRQHFFLISNWQSPEIQLEKDKYKTKCANENNFSVIRILQEDVYYDKYDWLLELDLNIKKIIEEKKVQNIFMCKNDEYKNHK